MTTVNTFKAHFEGRREHGKDVVELLKSTPQGKDISFGMLTALEALETYIEMVGKG